MAITLNLSSTLGIVWTAAASGSLNIQSDGATVLALSSTGVAITGLLDISGATSGQLKFPATQNASSDANTLDDYDEYTAASAACTGAVTATVVWRLVKVGKLVTLHLPVTESAGVATSSFSYGTVIPAKYRPPATIDFTIALLKNNGAYVAQPGIVEISGAGVISVYRDATTPNFTVTANAGIAPVAVSWMVA